MSVFRRLTGRGGTPPPVPYVPAQPPPPPAFDPEPAEAAYRTLLELAAHLRASAAGLAGASESVAAREAQLRKAVDEYDRIAREAIAHGRSIQAESAIASSEAAEAALAALAPQVAEVGDQRGAMEAAAARIEAQAGALRGRLDSGATELGDVAALVREAEDQTMRLEARARTLAAQHDRPAQA